MQTKRTAYFVMAGVILLGIVSYDFIYRGAPKVKALTIGTSSNNAAAPSQRHVVATSRGVLVAFFNSGTSAPTGIAYSTSADGGTTWSSLIQVDATDTPDFGVTIDGNDSIYVAYSDNSGLGGGSIFIRKLTLSGSSWQVGSASTVVAAVAGSCTSVTTHYYSAPQPAVTSDNKVWVSTHDSSSAPTTCKHGEVQQVYYSTSLTSWSSSTGFPTATSAVFKTEPLIVTGTSLWTVSDDSWLYANIGGGTSFAKVAQLSSTVNNGGASLAYGLDAVYILYGNTTGGVLFQKYDLSSSSLSATTVISSSTTDVPGQVSTDSYNIWATYQSYVGANSYNVVYKKYNGTSSLWDASPSSVTTDNLNNLSINAPERLPSTNNIPLNWTEGTANPYNIKIGVISGLGSVTDTGNQSANYTGTLTGSSGDVIVKCGTWYYDSINIVNGMTVKVCSSNGQIGGQLVIYANSITVAGTIDGTGRGMPGGMSIKGAGGAGGSGGGIATVAGAGGTVGGSGGTGTSYSGGKGSGIFGSNGGAGGTNGAGGTGGTAPSSGASSSSGGGGGGGGNGTSTTAGISATLAGYLGNGVNGDSSTDDSLTFGSGAGAGGGGGSGGGGAGGGGGAISSNVAAGNYCGGIGGQGGIGGAGGTGGKGGNGGALIKIYANGNVNVSGSIVAKGVAGLSGGSAGSGSLGNQGGSGFYSGTTSQC